MFLFDPGYPIFRLFGTHFVIFQVLWDLKKMKCENGGVGISTSNIYNLTNTTRVLFTSVFRFFFSFILPSIRPALKNELVFFASGEFHE